MNGCLGERPQYKPKINWMPIQLLNNFVSVPGDQQKKKTFTESSLMLKLDIDFYVML